LRVESRDAAHALQKIEDDALTGKNDARIVANYGYGLSFVQAHPVENLRVRGDFVVGGHSSVEGGVHIENARHTTDSGEDAILFGDNGRGRALVGVDAGVAGGIARRPVFDQRVLQDGGEASRIPIHKTVASFQLPARAM